MVTFLSLDSKNKITISGYGGRDYLNFVFNNKSQEKTGFKYDWGNKTGSIRWTRVFNSRLFANFWVTGSRFSSNFDLGEIAPVVEKNQLNDVTLKGNLEYHYSQFLQTKFGFEQKNLHVLYQQDFPNGKVDVDFQPKHYIAYFQTNWRPTAHWDIETGIRYNYFKSNKSYQDIEPRFSAKYRLTETINLKASSGLYKQYLHRIPRTFVSDIWTISNRDHEPSTSQHYILGFQKEVANYYQFEFEAYYKDYQNIHSFNQTFITEIEPGARDENGNPIYTSSRGLFHEGDGNSYGIEILMRKDKGVVTGWLGYSFAKTRVSIKEINKGREYSPRHDRHSIVNLVNKFDIRNFLRMLRKKPLANSKNRWILGINFVYASGQPITIPTAGYIVGVSPNAAERYVEFYPSSINRYRLPAYARLDLSLTYQKTYKNWSMEPYLQVFNVGNRKNIWFINYEFENGVSNVKTIQMFPILPTAGINFYF
jgi:hypothetical protein